MTEEERATRNAEMAILRAASAEPHDAESVLILRLCMGLEARGLMQRVGSSTAFALTDAGRGVMAQWT